MVPFIDSRERLNLVTGFATMDEACAGTLNLTTCTLDSAVGPYNVSISQDTVTLETPVQPTIVGKANNTIVELSETGSWVHQSTLMGLSDFLENQESALFQVLGDLKPVLPSTRAPSLPY